mmetsp:Transcript_4877/g.8895  ORF Transcript_4877/g.8895 Transcript_4877/m.8895 type:complete len:204 (-) Transcript_4877:279-890(-)
MMFRKDSGGWICSLTTSSRTSVMLRSMIRSTSLILAGFCSACWLVRFVMRIFLKQSSIYLVSTRWFPMRAVITGLTNLRSGSSPARSHSDMRSIADGYAAMMHLSTAHWLLMVRAFDSTKSSLKTLLANVRYITSLGNKFSSLAARNIDGNSETILWMSWAFCVLRRLVSGVSFASGYDAMAFLRLKYALMRLSRTCWLDIWP